VSEKELNSAFKKKGLIQEMSVAARRQRREVKSANRERNGLLW